MKNKYPLAVALLAFWHAQDWRRETQHVLSPAMFSYSIKQIARLGKLVTDEIMKRQLAGIPAPDLFQGVES